MRKQMLPRPRGDALRWQLSSGTFGIPPAAAPIAFVLLAMPLTGHVESEAALVLAMTAAPVVRSLPLSQLRGRISSCLGVLTWLVRSSPAPS